MQNKGEVHRLGSKKANRPPRIEQTKKDKPVEQCYTAAKRVDIDQHECKFRTSKCDYCGKEGHIAEACRNKGKREELKIKSRYGKTRNRGHRRVTKWTTRQVPTTINDTNYCNNNNYWYGIYFSSA